MLEHLDIKNFLVVESLSLECDPGFLAITGETGAGKSVWVDALCLALGQRVEGNPIRQDCDRATITASFDISTNRAAKQWLQQQAIDHDDNQCILRRVISRDGRSRATINGIPCSLNTIRELAPLLIQIHSQQLQRSLVKPDYQRKIVDAYANNEKILIELNDIYQQWLLLNSELDTLNRKLPDREQQLELLHYQLNELEQLNLQPNEWQTLSEQHHKLHQAQHIKGTIQQALTLTSTDETHAADTLIQQAQQHLGQLSFKDDSLDNIQSLLSTANIHLEEAIQELHQYYRSVDISLDEIQQLDQRLSLIHELARKHHTTPELLHAVQASLNHKVSELEHIDEKLQALQAQLHSQTQAYHQCAQQLSKARDQASNQLAKAMTKQMQTLAMKGGKFNIHLHTNTDQISATGYETLVFVVATNPGSPEGTLQQVASGGELSRMSLAIHALLADRQHIPTMIFDEVDTGISGKTATIVGQSLQTLGQHTQVICITHLAQVAAQANHQYCVQKHQTKDSTTATTKKLSTTERVDEIARLIGGETITDAAQASAKELLGV